MAVSLLLLLSALTAVLGGLLFFAGARREPGI